MLTYSSDREVIYSPQNIQIGSFNLRSLLHQGPQANHKCKTILMDYLNRNDFRLHSVAAFLFKFSLVAVLTVLQSEVS